MQGKRSLKALGTKQFQSMYLNATKAINKVLF